MKNLITSQLLTLYITLFSININYAQTTYGTGAGTQGGVTSSYFGQYAGQNNTDVNNSFFGYQAGKDNVSGSSNSFFGSASGWKNIDGIRNSFFGSGTGYDNTEGSFNSFIGTHAGQYNTIGSYNSFFGYRSGFSNLEGSQNSFIGTLAGNSNTNGNLNSFFGYWSGRFNETGEKNIFLGAYSGYNNVVGMDNTFLGCATGYYATGNSNVFIGYEAGKQASGSSNVFIGNQTGYFETGDNKLYIANSSTNEPLIYGDFANSELTFKAQIGIASSTGTSLIKNEQYNGNGITENFLRIKANANSGKSLIISETGRIALGSDDICMKHTTIVDSTYLILEGNAVKTGSAMWHSTSDMNLKKNITPLKNSLNKFLNLNFYSYQYKKTNQTRYGILAQEMEEIFPHSMGKLIEEDGTEYLTFNPNNLFYTGFKATQEIGEMSLSNESKIESLEKENDQLINITNNLEKENNLLKAELEVIKTALINNGIDLTLNSNNDNPQKPEVPHLLQNEPNPFTETTTIPYFLPQNIQDAFIVIYDATGKTIEKHGLPSRKGSGNLELSLMKKTTSKGAYSYSLIVDGKLIDNKKMLVQ